VDAAFDDDEIDDNRCYYLHHPSLAPTSCGYTAQMHFVSLLPSHLAASRLCLRKYIREKFLPMTHMAISGNYPLQLWLLFRSAQYEFEVPVAVHHLL
jgi:hypothetical protein